MSETRLIHGFHAVIAKLRHDPEAVEEIYIDAARQDARMRDLLRQAGVHATRVLPVDAKRLDGMAAGGRHQGVVARVNARLKYVSVDDVLDLIDEPALLLVLDGVQDPHNLGACLRVADAVGAHAVIAPKDKAVGLNATAIKVASGAADTVPYITVTNLARTLRDLQEREIWTVGADGDATKSLYDIDQGGGARMGARRGRQRPAPFDARDLRRTRGDSDARHGRKPQCVGRERHLSVRDPAAAFGRQAR